MASFNDIPTELVTTIVNICAQSSIPKQRNAKENLCNLRLVSRFIHNLATPVLFHQLSLDFRHELNQPYGDISDYIRCQEIVDALASGTTKVFERTTSLSFEPGRIYGEFWAQTCIENNIQSTIGEKLHAAILALKNLKLVSYRMSKEDPLSVSEAFIKAVGVHSRRGSISFGIIFDRYIQPQASLSYLSNLRMIKIEWGKHDEDFIRTELSGLLIRCPDLEALSLCRGFTLPLNEEIDANFGELLVELDEGKHTLPLKLLKLQRMSITLEDFQSATRHFRHLCVLDMTEIQGPLSTTLGEICRELKASEIWLKGLVVEFIDDPLVRDYLMSYSGLKSLELHGLRPNQWAQDLSCFVDRSFKELLPQHEATLEELILKPGGQEIWARPLTCDQMKGIVKCQKLRTLRVHWVADSRLGNDLVTILAHWLEVALQLPDLERLLVVPNSSLFFPDQLTPEEMFDMLNNTIDQFVLENYGRIGFCFEDSMFLRKKP